MSAVFAALADPTRRRILQRLAREGEYPVTALARPFHMSLPAISRHLRVLERARLIQRQRHGREHLIRANAVGFSEARNWLLECALHWDASFDALENILQGEKRGVPFDRRKGKKT